MAAASFERALKLVLLHEGGFVNHPKDPGGATNLGITIGTARRLGIDVDGDGDTDIVDIKLLRPSDAAKVYRAEFWNKVRGDDLPPGVDYAVFDFAVNSGPARAIAALQRAVGVADDGRLGPVTIAAAVSRPGGTTIERVCSDRLAFMKRLSTWPTFGKGWASRVEGVRAEGLAMAKVAVPTVSVETKPLPPPTPPVFAPAPRNGGVPAATAPIVPAAPAPAAARPAPSLATRILNRLTGRA